MEKLAWLIERALEREDAEEAEVLIGLEKEVTNLLDDFAEQTKLFTEVLNSLSLGKVMKNEKEMD